MTALMVAMKAMQTPIVHYLLGAGVDINARDKHGHSALGHAITNKQNDYVKLLVVKGADVKTPGGVSRLASTSMISAL